MRLKREISRMNSRGVTIEEAARFVGLTVNGYRSAARRCVFPRSIPGTRRYDIKAIEAALDRLGRIMAHEMSEPVSASQALDAWRANENRSEARPCDQKAPR